MSITALKSLAESSKATVVVGVIAIVAIMLYIGKIDSEQFMNFLKTVVPAWLISHAGEKAAKAIAASKTNEAAPSGALETE